MSSLNKVFLLGRLGQDPELRYTANQVPVVTLNIATTEAWAGKDGQRQEQTEWHRGIVWNRQAENCAKYLAKGRIVFVEGRLQTRSWDDKNGQKRYTTEITASNVQFMPGGGANPSPGRPAASPEGSFPGENSGFAPLPGSEARQSSAAPYEPPMGSVGGMSLDDIPFMRLNEWGH